jgi:hypothetical protein
VTRYRLVVFPPGISDAERRRVRVARGWVLWGALVWVFCEISLNQVTGPWTALVTSTAIYLGLGLVATAKAGDPRRQVRMIGTMVIAGHHDPVAAALHHKLENLAGALLEADEQLARGKISAVPAVILLTVRYVIVRQNRLAGAPTNAAPDGRRRSGCATPTHRRRTQSAL